jgi:hypothetical protein
VKFASLFNLSFYNHTKLDHMLGVSQSLQDYLHVHFKDFIRWPRAYLLKKVDQISLEG